MTRAFRPSSVLHGLCEPIEYPEYADMYKTWDDRFPGSLQKLHASARASLDEHGLLPADYKLDVIVKREKTGHVDELGPTANDPRAVLSPTQKLNVFIGPWFHHYSKVVCDRYKVEPGRFACIAIGTTAEELGEWYSWAVDHFTRLRGRPPFRRMLDQKRYDREQRKGAHSYFYAMAQSTGIPQDVLDAAEKVSHVSGRIMGKQWISFRCKGQRQVSGIQYTAIMNSGNGLSTFVDIHGEPGPDTYAVVDTGDDLLAIGVLPSLAEPEEVLNRRYGHYGLQVTASSSIDDADVEFISLIPYPTSEGIVFGPKIGRQLYRAGWTTSSEKADIYGASVSLQDSVSFIPFLKQFFDVHRRLSKREGPVRAFDRLASREHTATAETYEFVERRYNLTRADEEQFNQLLDQVTSLPALITWPRINDVAARDE